MRRGFYDGARKDGKSPEALGLGQAVESEGMVSAGIDNAIIILERSGGIPIDDELEVYLDATTPRNSPLCQRILDDMRMRKFAGKTQGHYIWHDVHRP